MSLLSSRTYQKPNHYIIYMYRRYIAFVADTALSNNVT